MENVSADTMEIESRMKERENEMTIILLIEKKNVINWQQQRSINVFWMLNVLFCHWCGNSIRHWVGKDDFPYIKYYTLENQRSEILRWWGWPIFCWLFASALCLAWFVLFLSGLYHGRRRGSHDSSPLCSLSIDCFSYRYTRSNVTTDPKSKKKGLGSLSSVTFHPVLFLPLAIRPMEHSHTQSIPLATCPLSSGSSSLLIHRRAIQINSLALSSIFNDSQHC